MHTNTLVIDEFLSSRFMKREMEYLQQQPLFKVAVLNLSTTAELLDLLKLAEMLLDEGRIYSPVARQYRKDSKVVSPFSPSLPVVER